ncbi:MAG TPA: hypothetical protein VGN18_17845 [Jatrophihabitans sp.]|jgi:hypothetical protein|uniref:hypothetical protein n=1 Tax=Jatrophihabitans sp. TaxID=1932789 RepID=UPI002E02BEED|nr:hypothetical protein [Jatrophihabitans sp.]
MSPAADDVARRLLDAQVEFVLAELTGDRLRENIARDVDDVLAVASALVVAEVVDAEQVKATARRLVDRIGGSPMVEDLVGAVSDALYDLTASEQYDLGAVIAREPVEALVAKVLSMHTLHDRALERLTESPLVATVASKFVTKIVSDFMQQNRARAEKLPGMSSLLSLGAGAASKVKGATDKHLDQFLGDAVGKGAQYGLRRTNNAIRELIRDAPLQAAAMEVWDLHADEPISGLREYLSQQDLRELAVLVHEIVVTALATEYTGHLIDECIDVFFARYGDRDVASLLPELGLTRDDLVEDLRTFAPPIIEAAKADGVLAGHIRARLAPFFSSPEVAAILSRPSPKRA